jgi:retron-type reverse transcriptase
MGDTTKSPTVSTKLQWVAQQSARYPEKVITSLAHLMDVDLLFAAYCKTRKDGAVGVDGVTAREYAEHLDENLVKLHVRLRSGQYRAPAVKRAGWRKTMGVNVRSGYQRSRTR